MRWKYKMVEKSNRLYIYAYSRETDMLDGMISFDREKHEALIIKPSNNDKNSKKAQDKAMEHFEAVINENFPIELYVCCG